MWEKYLFQFITLKTYCFEKHVNYLKNKYLKNNFLQVDDGEYFQTLPENSIFMFLRSGESWHPTGSDSIKAGMKN